MSRLPSSRQSPPSVLLPSSGFSVKVWFVASNIIECSVSNCHVPIRLLSAIGLLQPTRQSNRPEIVMTGIMCFIVCVLGACALPPNESSSRMAGGGDAGAQKGEIEMKSIPKREGTPDIACSDLLGVMAEPQNRSGNGLGLASNKV